MKISCRSTLQVLCTVLLIIISVYSVPANSKFDPKAFVTIGDHKYYISPDTNLVDAREAMTFCNDIDMRLINLETSEKNSLIRDYLNTNGLGSQNYWTGGRKLLGYYYWTGLGQLFTFTDWDKANGDPDDQNVDSCVNLWGQSGWRDYGCEGITRFICE